MLTYLNTIRLSAYPVVMQCQAKQAGSFCGSAFARARRSLFIRAGSSLLRFPVRQSPVRQGMSSAGDSGVTFAGISTASRRFRLQSHERHGLSSSSVTLDFLFADSAALTAFRILLRSIMSRLHCQLRHGLSSSSLTRWDSSSARFRAQFHDKQGFVFSSPSGAPAVILATAIEMPSKTNGQAPIFYLPTRKQNRTQLILRVNFTPIDVKSSFHAYKIHSLLSDRASRDHCCLSRFPWQHESSKGTTVLNELRFIAVKYPALTVSLCRYPFPQLLIGGLVTSLKAPCQRIKHDARGPS